MTIDYHSPFGGSPIGPGVLLFVNHISPPVVPAGSFWDVEVLPAAGTTEFPTARYRFPAVSPNYPALAFNFGDPGIPQVGIPGQRVPSVEASSVQLRTRITGPVGEVLDENIQSTVWTGVHEYLLFPKIGGGTAPADPDIQIIKAAVTPVAVNLQGLLNGLQGILTHPPFGILQEELIVPPRTGDGSLIRPFAPVDQKGVAAVGLTWAVVDVPDGIGIQNGNPNLYRSRILQTSTIHTSQQGVDFVSEAQDWNINHYWWMWRNPLPTRVQYSILPGVVLNFFWLIFPTT